MTTATTLAYLLFASLGGVPAAVAPISDAPKAIQELAAAIQGKDSDTVHAEIIRRFGFADRDVGSGFRIEKWDLSGGVLTFHPMSGPTFVDAKTDKFFRLLRTTNLAGDNLLQRYSMMTLPDPQNNGSQYWLGSVEFGADGTYRFVDGRAFPEELAKQRDNFFVLYPAGKVVVRYAPPITAETRLETLPENSVVAHFDFTSDDGNHRATFSIKSSERFRTLAFTADQRLTFEMDTSWRNFWR
jgi:hypothetical protein